MDDQLDKDIKNRIREVFDNYEDPSADEGWLLLREKFPEEKKRRPIAWLWWSAAALFLLFLGFGLWEFEKSDSMAKLTTNKTHAPLLHQNVEAQKSVPDRTKDARPSTNKNEDKTGAANIARNNSSMSKSIYGPQIKNIKPPKFQPVISDTSNKIKIARTPTKNEGVKNAAIQQLPPNQFAATNQTNTNKPAIKPEQGKPAATQQAVNQFAATNQTNTNNPAIKPEPGKPATAQPTANQFAATNQTNINSPVIKPQPGKPVTTEPSSNQAIAAKPAQAAKSIASMFADDNQPLKDNVSGNKKVLFGVYAATYFSYARGSGNQANLGAGVSAEIPLAKNLTLVTGLTVAQNSLAFNSSIPTASAQNAFFAPGSSSAVGASSNSVPGPNTQSEYAISEITNASVPAFKSYNANLVGLEVPLDLKYDVNTGKNNVYVLAGFSSGTFINETYTYQYNYPALASPTLQQVKDATSHNSFDSFYFGKMLNFAVGVGYPLGKNRIVLEPFLKYPLQGLGAQDIKFGSGGINLKFNFSTGKK